jgi:two-component system heavy metal sensor histidine kinase CusS
MKFRRWHLVALSVVVGSALLSGVVNAGVKNKNGSREQVLSLSDLPNAASRDLRVSWQLAKSTAVETDPGKIRIVLNNLYDNAISHTDEHGTISIQSHINTKSFTVQINNAASAVSPGQADRVFDRFWQADPARNSTGRHFGLGLGLCKRIVERLGGSINVLGNDGQFQVRVDLPQGQVGS